MAGRDCCGLSGLPLPSQTQVEPGCCNCHCVAVCCVSTLKLEGDTSSPSPILLSEPMDEESSCTIEVQLLPPRALLGLTFNSLGFIVDSSEQRFSSLGNLVSLTVTSRNRIFWVWRYMSVIPALRRTRKIAGSSLGRHNENLLVKKKKSS